MTFTEELREANAGIWEQYYQHPFILGIQNGDLDIEKFKFYMIQDYLYLWEYVKLAAIGIIKSETEQQLRDFFDTISAVLDDEMSIHRSYLDRLGVSDDELHQAEPSMVSTAYTNYMLAVANTGGLDEVIAAFLSCAWTYTDIVTEIDRRNPEAKRHEIYGQWISGYLNENFKKVCDHYLAWADRIGEVSTPQHRAKLAGIFRNCCMFELAFWDMAEAKTNYLTVH